MGILHECLDKKQYNKLQLLIALGHDPNELDRSGKNLLIKAMKKIADDETRIRIMETLVASGININYQNTYGETALMIAAGEGLIAEMELLVRENSDINLCNKRGESALYYACNFGSIEAAGFLIASDSKIDAFKHKFREHRWPTNHDPEFVSFWVAKWLNAAWLYVCLQSINDINITDDNGESLLFHALHDINSVRILLDAGINVNIRNHKGETVLTNAKKYFHGKDPGLMQLLIEHDSIE